MSQSILNSMSTKPSFLLDQSQLKPRGVNVKKKAVPLIITSLVDAFSILVIYLLFGPSVSGENIDPQLGVSLPMAYHSELAQDETTLMIKNDGYYIKNKRIELAQLTQELKKVSQTLSNDKDKSKSLVIVADQKNDIEKINPVLIAASEAGMNQLRLAVEHQGE